MLSAAYMLRRRQTKAWVRERFGIQVDASLGNMLASNQVKVELKNRLQTDVVSWTRQVQEGLKNKLPLLESLPWDTSLEWIRALGYHLKMRMAFQLHEEMELPVDSAEWLESVLRDPSYESRAVKFVDVDKWRDVKNALDPRMGDLLLPFESYFDVVVTGCCALVKVLRDAWHIESLESMEFLQLARDTAFKNKIKSIIQSHDWDPDKTGWHTPSDAPLDEWTDWLP